MSSVALEGGQAEEAHPYDVTAFFVLACALTWALQLPLVLAWVGQVEPPAYAPPLAGQVLRFLVLVIAAAFAARSLSRAR